MSKPIIVQPFYNNIVTQPSVAKVNVLVTGGSTSGGGGGGATAFTQLTDVPSSYGGQALKLVRVNSLESGLEFFTPTYLTANQTITLTGDVTGSGATGITTTIGSAAVTYAKFQATPAVSFLGNPTGISATIQPITLGAGLSFSGTTLVNTGLTSISAGTDINITGTTINDTATLASITSRGATTSQGVTFVENANLSSSFAIYLQRNSDSGSLGYFIQGQNNAGNTDIFYVDVLGNLFGSSFIVNGATSSQFLKGDGSLDSSAYLTVAALPTTPLTVITASGTNTYSATPSPALGSYTTDQAFYILFTNSNTGASTLNLNGLGAVNIIKNGSEALESGDIGAGQIIYLIYDGTSFQIVNGAPRSLYNDRGNYDASVNAYPSTGGSGGGGAIKKGDIWTISVGGTLPTSQVVNVGDTIRALIDTPGNTQANWAINNSATVASSSDLNTGTNNTKFASALALEGSKYLDQDGSKLYATASGTDTYAATISPAIAAYTTGQLFNITFTNANTTVSTLNLNTLGAITLKKANGDDIGPNQITAGATLELLYNGTNFIIFGGLSEEPFGTGTTTDATTYVTIASTTISSDCNVLIDKIWLSGKSGSNTAFYQGVHRARRISGTLALVKNIVNILTFSTGSDSALNSCVARINLSGDTLQLQVKGVAATTINWKGGFKPVFF